jgi:hypothetical protein
MLDALLHSGASASQIVFATIAPFGKHGLDSIPDVMMPSISNSSSLFGQVLIELSVIASDSCTDTTGGLAIKFSIKSTLSKKGRNGLWSGAGRCRGMLPGLKDGTQESQPHVLVASLQSSPGLLLALDEDAGFFREVSFAHLALGGCLNSSTILSLKKRRMGVDVVMPPRIARICMLSRRRVAGKGRA